MCLLKKDVSQILVNVTFLEMDIYMQVGTKRRTADGDAETDKYRDSHMMTEAESGVSKSQLTKH